MSEPAVLPMPSLGAPPVPVVPHPRRHTLANGLRLVAAPVEGLPQVVLRLVVPAGSAADPATRRGMASLTGHLLAEGTHTRGAEQLHARIDLLGAALHPQVGHDFAEVELVLLSETLAEGIELLAEVVTTPAFPADQVERVRAETLDALLSRGDEPSHVADDLVLQEVFGSGHAYGYPAFGDEAGIRGVSREELIAFHHAWYRPEGAFVVAAGEFDPEELSSLLEQAFRDWKGAPPPLAWPPLPENPARAGRLVTRPWRDAAQSEIRIGGMGLPRLHPDWVPAGVANFLLGGSTITGRLGANLREDKGWTYGVRSAFSAGVVPGGWLAETAVDVEVTAPALREMLAEMERLGSDPVDESELRRAKDALMLSLPRVFETPAAIASRLATVEAYGLPHDWWERFPGAVEAVTREEVRAMARRHFAPGRLVQVVVGGGVTGEK